MRDAVVIVFAWWLATWSAYCHSQDAKLLRSQAASLNAQALKIEQADRAAILSHNMQYGTVPAEFGPYQHFVPMHWCAHESDLMRELNKAGDRHAAAVFINIEASICVQTESQAKYHLSSKWWKENKGEYPRPWHLMNPEQQREKFCYDLDWMSKTVYDVRQRLLKESNLRQDEEIGVYLGQYFCPAECVQYLSQRNPGVSAPASGIKAGQYPPLASMVDCWALDYYKPPDLSVATWLGPDYVPQALDRFLALPGRKYAWVRVETDPTDKHLPGQYLPADTLRAAMRVCRDRGVDGITLVEFVGAKWDQSDLARVWGEDNPYSEPGRAETAVSEFVRKGK